MTNSTGGSATHYTKRNTLSDQVIQHVMTAADKEFADFSVSRLAASFKIDRYKLSRQFKQKTNMTLEYFLFKEKMTRAAFLLKSEDKFTVKEVAVRVGYSSYNYFIRKFKEYYGITPTMYKELKVWRSGFKEKKRKNRNHIN